MNLSLPLKVITVLGCSLMCLTQVPSWAAPSGPPVKHHPYWKPPTVPPALQKLRSPEYWSEQKKEADALTDTKWVNEPWTGNDAPYAAARAQVERALAATPPQTLVAQYAVRAKQNSNDPLAQFTWAYAVHRGIELASFPSQDADNARFAAELALAEAPFPQTYNYARLKFLIWMQGGPGSHPLKIMAYRLLQKDPNDFPVTAGLIRIYSANRDRSAQKQGYALIQKMIKRYPQKPDVYDLLGGWYYFQYLSYHNPRDYHSAMANYQKAMNMYPETEARRYGLPEVMNYLTRRYHQISSGGA